MLLMRSHRFGRPLAQPRTLGSCILALAIASGIFAIGGGKAASADLLIEGEPNAIHIEAHDVRLRQVLDAMQAKFDLHYRTDDALDSPVTGIFNGQLRRVAVRLLEDYDFVMKMTPEGIDVLVMQRNQHDIKPAVAALPAKQPVRSTAPVTTPQEANRYERGQAR